MLSTFKEFLFVPHCIICNHAIASNSANINLCADCLGDIDFINEPYCPDCHGPITDKRKHSCRYNKTLHYTFDYAISVLEYHGAIKTSHHNFKFHHRPSYAKTLASLIYNKIKTLPFNIGADIIIPIPLGKKRLKSRGYNQAGLIAKYLASYLKTDFSSTSLIRIRETEPQHSLNLYQRRLNVMGSFAVKDKSAVIGKRVMLIDDVISSGNTINEAAATLIKNGASSVIVATFAATPYKNSKDIFDTELTDINEYNPEDSDMDYTYSLRVCPSPLFELRKNKEQ